METIGFCLQCNKEFIKKRKDKKFCSARCYYKKNWKRHYINVKKWQKENPGKWKQIYTNNRIKNTLKNPSLFKFKKSVWHFARKHRKELLRKSNYICKKCKRKFSSNKLEIHHLKYTNEFKDMVVLCGRCHKSIHSYWQSLKSNK